MILQKNTLVNYGRICNLKEGESIGLIDQNDLRLVERSGRRTVATTDPKTGCIYLSNELRGKFLTKVLLHELGHCVIFSFNLLDDIHRMVLPKYWFEAEEWVCNFIADYGESIFGVAYSILGEDAWGTYSL